MDEKSSSFLQTRKGNNLSDINIKNNLLQYMQSIEEVKAVDSVGENAVNLTVIIDFDKMANDIITALSNEEQYSPDVNQLICNETLLRKDYFTEQLENVGFWFKFLREEKQKEILELANDVEDFLDKQYNGLDTEFSGYLEKDALLFVKKFFKNRLDTLRVFLKKVSCK